ncbi:MAG: LamG-like jellyroll fold domain-containing protein [Verrucomicrobiota bacterium]
MQLAFDPERRTELLALDSLTLATTNDSAENCIAVLARRPPTTTRAAEQEAPKDGLLAQWEFEDANAVLATHETPAGHDLKLNGVRRTAEGHTGGALEFDGQHFAEIAPSQPIEFLRTDLTFAAWINTREDGTILAQTQLDEPWMPDGKSWFINGGRLTFDVGWVGAVASSTPVADGRWHHVAMTWSHTDGLVMLFVDGQSVGSGHLQPRKEFPSPVLRVGFTAPNFPKSPWFRDGWTTCDCMGAALNAHRGRRAGRPNAAPGCCSLPPWSAIRSPRAG